ncbi:MAG: transketolase [Bacteroidetes bacterium]|nr:transketolase [Bacteroidota bacterium]
MDLIRKATEIRKDIILSLAEAGSGHLGGSLGMADVFTVLYFNVLNHRPDEPDWQERDRLILSIGHIAPVLYTTLAHAGYFPTAELMTLRKLGSRLQGHPSRETGLPGIEVSSGSLGQGLSVSVGLALAGKMDQQNWKVYCILGDGELQEGSVWEAAMSASHHKLNNLVAIVDRNFCQIDGNTPHVMELEPLAGKWEAFGWLVIECNGNDVDELIDAFQQARFSDDRPVVILARTIMGKGVKSIENDFRWHGKVPDDAQKDSFIAELLLNQ